MQFFIGITKENLYLSFVLSGVNRYGSVLCLQPSPRATKTFFHPWYSSWETMGLEKPILDGICVCVFVVFYMVFKNSTAYCYCYPADRILLKLEIKTCRVVNSQRCYFKLILNWSNEQLTNIAVLKLSVSYSESILISIFSFLIISEFSRQIFEKSSPENLAALKNREFSKIFLNFLPLPSRQVKTLVKIRVYWRFIEEISADQEIQIF